MTMSAVGKLEEEALKRKERLQNLKRKFDSGDQTPESDKYVGKDIIPK